MRKIGITAILLLCAFNFAWSQLNYANRLYEEEDYESAAVLYEKVLEKDSTELEAIEKLATCYNHLKKYKLAEKYFSKAVKYENADAESFLYYGQILKNHKKVGQAKMQFQKYLDKKPESLLGKVLLQSCDAIADWTSEPTEFIVTNIKEINTEYLELSPFLLGNKLVFTSDKNHMIAEGDSKSSKSLDGDNFSIYIYDSTNAERPIQSISDHINSMDNIEGPAYFNSSGNRMYYTKVFSRQRYVVNQMEIHTAKLDGESWSKDEPFTFNDKNFSLTNPVVSPDERLLYFSSDMPGGAGGFDIYVSEKTDEGYTKPVNLGSVINTSGNEIPCYVSDDNQLFFSSDFHPRFGGLDVFKSKKETEWSVPENLKVPFNSSLDDLGYILVAEESGYFASNRDGGAGQDDIYYFTRHSFTDSSFYTDINGLFMLDTLPMLNMSLVLLDENDEIIQMTVTNESGQFSFKNVPSDKNYKILINEEPEKVPEEAKIYLTNDKYERIMLIERLQKGMFKFEALDRAEYGGLSLMDEVDENGLPTLVILGQLSSSDATVVTTGKKVYVVDDAGNIVAIAVSDEMGKFRFEKLSIDDEYLFRLEEADPAIDIHIINTKGEVLGKTVQNKDGNYVYHKFTINPSGQPDIRGVFKYGNLPADGVTLMLVGEDDEILMVTQTNVKGEFEFHNLEAGTKYSIKVDSNVKVPGSANMFIMDKHTGIYLPVSKLAGGEFSFETLAPIAPEELALMDEEDVTIVPRHDIIGQVYSNQNKIITTGTVVQFMDGSGNVVAIAKTEDKGIFKFQNLPVDDQYLFGIAEDDPSLSIRILNSESGVIGEAQRNENNQFVYHKFSINPSKKPDVRGVFKYGNLPANDVTLNLVDESDNIMQITKTDNTGQFKFTKLKSGTSYRIEVDPSEGTVPDNAQMLVYDDYTGMLLPVSKLANGSFKFETLGMMEAEDIALIEEEDETLVRFSFFAQIFSELPYDLGENLEIFIVDDKGNIIAIARSDKFGKFNFENLPLQDEYLIKLKEDDPNLELKVITKEGETIGVLKRNKRGEFVFNRNEVYGKKPSETLATTETKGNSNTSGPAPAGQGAKPGDKGTVPSGSPSYNASSASTLSFEFGRTRLVTDSRNKLDIVAETLNKESNVKIQVNSYSDSHGPADFNLLLSDLRSQEVKKYLMNKGIAAERISIANYGETGLLNECSDDVSCPPEKHAINRRVELKYLR